AISPVISFSADQSQVSIQYGSYNYNIPRPVVVPWNYTAAGHTYWVAGTGDDNNTGSSTSPFATINKAVAMAGPGDIVYIEPGTYVETLFITKSGLPSAPIIISCAPGALGQVTITPSATWGAANPDGSVIRLCGATYVWINGLNIQGPMGQPYAPTSEHYMADGITWQNGAGAGNRATNNVVYSNVHCGLKAMDQGSSDAGIDI